MDALVPARSPGSAAVAGAYKCALEWRRLCLCLCLCLCCLPRAQQAACPPHAPAPPILLRASLLPPPHPPGHTRGLARGVCGGMLASGACAAGRQPLLPPQACPACLCILPGLHCHHGAASAPPCWPAARPGQHTHDAPHSPPPRSSPPAHAPHLCPWAVGRRVCADSLRAGRHTGHEGQVFVGAGGGLEHQYRERSAEGGVWGPAGRAAGGKGGGGGWQVPGGGARGQAGAAAQLLPPTPAQALCASCAANGVVLRPLLCRGRLRCFCACLGAVWGGGLRG